MKFLIVVITILFASSSFAMRPSAGFYRFYDPISSVKPIWKLYGRTQYPISASSSQYKKSNARYQTSIDYFKSSGALLKSEFWIENRKKRKAKLISVINYNNTIKFDSIRGFQVEYMETESGFYYDSINFKRDGTLEYRYIYSVENEFKDTTITHYNLIEHSERVKKYEISNQNEIISIYTYLDDRPVRIIKDKYTDSISYDDFDNYTITTYYFKGKDDTVFYIGEKDSVSDGLIHSKQFFERYYPHVSIYEKYFFDGQRRLVLKTTNNSHRVYIYHDKWKEEYTIFPGITRKSVHREYKTFPFKGWKLKGRLTR